MQINHVFPNAHAQKIIEYTIDAIKAQQDAGTAPHFEMVLTLGFSFGEMNDSEALSKLQAIKRALAAFSEDIAARLHLVVEPVSPVNAQMGQYVEKAMQTYAELQASATPKLALASDLNSKG